MPPKNEKRKKPKKIVSEGIYYDKEGNLELWIDAGEDEGIIQIVYTSIKLPDHEDWFYELIAEIPYYMDDRTYKKIKSMYTFH